MYEHSTGSQITTQACVGLEYGTGLFTFCRVEHSYFRAALIGLDDWSLVLCTQAVEVQTRFHMALNCVAVGGSYSYTYEHSSTSNGKYHIITNTTSSTTRLEMSPKILNQDFSVLVLTQTYKYYWSPSTTVDTTTNRFVKQLKQ